MKRSALPVLLMIAGFQLPAYAAVPPAAAGPLSAAELHGMCTSASDVDYGYCAGYVSALSHTLLTQKIGGYSACNQTNVRSQQLVDTFNSWAEVFPDRLNTDADSAVAAALARAFPCLN